MSCCQCQGVDRFFNNRVSQRELKKYRKKGPRGSTRKFVRLLEELDMGGKTLLDIGGGIGVIQHELIKKGLSKATHVDASRAYLEASRQEAHQNDHAHKIKYLFGDFADVVGQIESHDLVTLDKVICCYGDMPELVKKSSEKARQWYAVVYPRATWWNKAGASVMNAGLWVIRDAFRVFIHPSAEVNRILKQAGFTRLAYKQSLIWQYIIYQRS